MKEHNDFLMNKNHFKIIAHPDNNNQTPYLAQQNKISIWQIFANKDKQKLKIKISFVE